MLQMGSILEVADNSGAKKLKLFGLVGSSGIKSASLGDVVVCAVNGATSTGVVKDHSVVKAVIVRTRKEVRRKDGSYIRFDDNAAVVIDDEGLPKGTRVFGPVARELRDAGYLKIVSFAPEVW